MTGDANRQIVLASRPVSYPRESDFKVVETPVPKSREGEVLVKAIWLSLDPYQRGRMRAARSYAPPVEVGEVITGGVVGRVVESRTLAFEVGDIVEESLGWQSHAVTDGRGLRKVDRSMGSLSYALGVLGMPGMTACFGLLDVGQPRPGDTVVVSATSAVRATPVAADRSVDLERGDGGMPVYYVSASASASSGRQITIDGLGGWCYGPAHHRRPSIRVQSV